MACGLGAVALMFVFIKESTFSPLNTDFSLEINEITEIINQLDADITNKSNKLTVVMEEISKSKKLAIQTLTKVNIVNESIKDISSKNIKLTAALTQLESKSETKYRPIKKEYISGCNVTGNKIIFLLDTSMSMLSKEVIDIISLSLQSDKVKNNSSKWITGKNTIRWLIDNTPETSKILIAGFNTKVSYDVAPGEWTRINERTSIEKQLINLFSNPPDKGTNLQNTIKGLSEWEDVNSIYLITDSLPTQSNRKRNDPTKSRCFNNDYTSGTCRIKFFQQFAEELEKLSSNVKLNTILLPMNGDPDAPYYFSDLSTSTGGCFMTPSKNWP
tara:strand:- start:942 stop:1931 length:990 start_codon:yes stop_codon:yes gene_type:complete